MNQLAQSQPSPQIAPARQVTAATERLHVLLDDLNHLTSAIDQRLTSVLRQEPSNICEQKPKALSLPPTAPLAAQLQSEADRLDGQVEMLRTLLDRIELN